MDAEPGPAAEPPAGTLRFYTQPATAAPLAWSWVDQQLQQAGTYWVVGRSGGHPHPRPVWGAWLDRALHLSLGSPVLRRQLDGDDAVTVHLDSGTDVVIVEGRVVAPDASGAAVAAYDRKYDYRYDVEQYGVLTAVAPTTVLAWRAAGPAGRDGFVEAGRWQLG